MARNTANLSPEKKATLYKALAESNESLTKLAARLGHDRVTVRLARTQLLQAGYAALSNQKPVEPPAPPKTIDIHDAKFWRNEATKLKREHGAMQRVIEELGGIRSVPFQLPEWTSTFARGRRGKAVVGMLVSDIHDGEVIRADEILGVNEYNPDICEQRMARYFEASCIIAARWAADCDIQGAMLALAGDLISGDIHEELSRTNALTAHEQVQHVLGVLCAGIEHVLEAFGRVHIIGVPGNHGRTTRKPTAKLYADLSYDTLVVSMIADRYKDDPRVTFQSGRSKDQITPIFGRTVLTTHGDKIGTRGGMGFAGAMLPIVRGSKLIIEQQGSVERLPDLIQFGHYHTTGNPYVGRPVLANGSVPGMSEFGDDLRRSVEPPQQWTYILHDRWWLRERQPIILNELKAPTKPVVRVPVEMSRA